MPEKTPKVKVQEGTFPIAWEEFVSTTRIGPYEAAGLKVFASSEERYREEWQALLEQFRARPITE